MSLIRFTVLLVCLLIVCSAVTANVLQDIVVDTVLQYNENQTNVYVVETKTILVVSAKLEICAGVTIELGEGSSIQVRDTGSLKAWGSEDNNVVFKSVDGVSVGWSELVFTNSPPNDLEGFANELHHVKIIGGGWVGVAALKLRSSSILVNSTEISGVDKSIDFTNSIVTIVDSDITSLLSQDFTGEASKLTIMDSVLRRTSPDQRSVHVTPTTVFPMLEFQTTIFESGVLIEQIDSLIIEGCEFKSGLSVNYGITASSVIQANHSISENTVYGSFQYLQSKSVSTLITSNTFTSVQSIIVTKYSGSLDFENNVITDTTSSSMNLMEIYNPCNSPAKISHNLFRELHAAIGFSLVTYEGENCIPLEFTDNHVANATFGVLFAPIEVSSVSPIVQRNVFEGLTAGQLVMSMSPLDISLAYNYWDAATSADIRSKISDLVTSHAAGFVSFSPFYTNVEMTSESSEDEGALVHIIEGTVTWNTPTTLDKSVWIKKDASLTISSNVTIPDDYIIFVDGELIINPPHKITFEINDKWRGIYFSKRAKLSVVDTSSIEPQYIEGSIIRNVDFQQASFIHYKGLITNDKPESNIFIDSCTMDVKKSRGIYSYAAVVKNSSIVAGTCIEVMGRDVATYIYRSNLTATGTAVNARHVAVIKNSHLAGQLALYSLFGDHINVSNNIIATSIYGLQLKKSKLIVVRENHFVGQQVMGMDVFFGENATAEISNNIFENINSVINSAAGATLSYFTFMLQDNQFKDIRGYNFLYLNLGNSNGTVLISRNEFSNSAASLRVDANNADLNISENIFTGCTADEYIQQAGKADFICNDNYLGESRAEYLDKIKDGRKVIGVGKALIDTIIVSPSIQSPRASIKDVVEWSSYFVQEQGFRILEDQVLIVRKDSQITLGGDLIIDGSASFLSDVAGGIRIVSQVGGGIHFTETASPSTLIGEAYFNGSTIQNCILNGVTVETDVFLYIANTQFSFTDPVNAITAKKGIQLTNSTIDNGSTSLSGSGEYFLNNNNLHVGSSSTLCAVVIGKGSSFKLISNNIYGRACGGHAQLSYAKFTSIANTWRSETNALTLQLFHSGVAIMGDTFTGAQAFGVTAGENSISQLSGLKFSSTTNTLVEAVKLTSTSCSGVIELADSKLENASKRTSLLTISAVENCNAYSVTLTGNIFRQNSVTSIGGCLISISGKAKLNRNIITGDASFSLCANTVYNSTTDATQNWWGELYGDLISYKLNDNRENLMEMRRIQFAPYLLSEDLNSNPGVVCSDSYSGSECQYPICGGLPSNDPKVCGGHGSCAGPRECTCEEGYQGSNCNKALCFDKLSDQQDVCNGNGVCISPDNCSCYSGFTGANCSIPDTNIPSISVTLDSNIPKDSNPFNRASTLLVTATVSPVADISNMVMSWQLYRYTEQVNLSSIVTEGASLNSRTISIKPMSLIEASSYNLVFTVKYSNGDSQTVKGLKFDTTSPPNVGTLTVEPKTGTALTTIFGFSNAGWSTNDGSGELEYAYGYTLQGKDYTLTSFSENVAFSAVLPSGVSSVYTIGRTKYGDSVRVAVSEISVSELSGDVIVDAVVNQTNSLLNDINNQTPEELQPRISSVVSTISQLVGRADSAQIRSVIDSVATTLLVKSSVTTDRNTVNAQVQSVLLLSSNIGFISNQTATACATVLKNAVKINSQSTFSANEQLDTIVEATIQLASTMLVNEEASNALKATFIDLVGQVLGQTRRSLLEQQARSISMNNLESFVLRSIRGSNTGSPNIIATLKNPSPAINNNNPVVAMSVLSMENDANSIQVEISDDVYTGAESMNSGSVLVEVFALNSVDLYPSSSSNSTMVSPIVFVQGFTENSTRLTSMTYNTTIPVNMPLESSTNYTCRVLNENNEFENRTDACTTLYDQATPDVVTCECVEPLVVSVSMDYVQSFTEDNNNDTAPRKGLAPGVIAAIVIIVVTVVLIVAVVSVVFAFVAYRMYLQSKKQKSDEMANVQVDNNRYALFYSLKDLKQKIFK